jgi:hypothetical protein
LDKIKKYGNAPHNRWKAEVYADGPTRVLQLAISDNSKTVSEQAVEAEILDTKMIIGFSGFGISLIDNAPQVSTNAFPTKISGNYVYVIRQYCDQLPTL